MPQSIFPTKLSPQKMNNYSLTKLICGFLFLLLPQLALGQLDDEYFVADQLLRQQKYEQASQKFQKLYEENPDTYIFLEKLTECLINLKEYDRAVSITKQAASRGRLRPQATIRLGEIQHISGNKEEAFKTWNKLLDQYKNNTQVYLKVARAMKDRRAFKKSIEIYEEVRNLSAGSNIVTSELAETYLQAGNYEKAMSEYLQLVRKNPKRMNFVQRRLIRFRDDYIYDVAILEISDFLEELSPTHPSYRNLQQLEIWLLMERNLYKRALVTAKDYEAQSSEVTYSLYNLGPKLLAAQEFELAEQAYSYYIDNNVLSLKDRSREELADVYTQWAKYLENYNLGLSSRRNALYEQAFSTLQTLREQNPNYRRMDNVLITLSELSLDILHEPDKGAQYLDELKSLSDDSTHIAQEAYIQGRLYLYDEEYTRARVSFTRSNNQERIGSLAEKTRYYLALTDFFSGDYEFAKIQLNALSRQNTSYYANDAVQLRLWIQNGLQADSTGSKLHPFAEAIEHFSHGNDQLGINKLKTLFNSDSYNPLTDEALIELSKYKDTKNARFVFQALSAYLETQGSASPLHERLLWERARLADQFVTNKEIDLSLLNDTSQDSLTTTTFNQQQQIVVPTNIEQLIPMYEEILLQFPGGFYSTYARDRIQELQKLQT